MTQTAPQRWLFVGGSGSGKSTYARRVAAAIEAPHIELDSIYHQENWTPLPDEVFRDRVGALVRSSNWVIDGNYKVVRPLVEERAEVIVALELPRRVVMRQVIARTWSRVTRREVLWNGNRESFLNILKPFPSKNIILWAFFYHPRSIERHREIERVAKETGVTFVRVSSHSDANVVLGELLGDKWSP